MEKGNRFKGPIALVMVALLLTLLALPATAAQGPMPDRGSRDSAPQGADDGYLEVGVEWVNDHPYCCRTTSSGTICGNNVCDLSLCDDDAKGLKNQLGYGGWIKRFDYGNGSAWEEDFKGYTSQEAAPSIGTSTPSTWPTLRGMGTPHPSPSAREAGTTTMHGSPTATAGWIGGTATWIGWPSRLARSWPTPTALTGPGA
jgi:hypothetical protein